MELLGYDKDEIIHALEIIRDICGANICDDCPFSKYGDCIIARDSPEDWHPRSNLTQWRAFD